MFNLQYQMREQRIAFLLTHFRNLEHYIIVTIFAERIWLLFLKYSIISDIFFSRVSMLIFAKQKLNGTLNMLSTRQGWKKSPSCYRRVIVAQNGHGLPFNYCHIQRVISKRRIISSLLHSPLACPTCPLLSERNTLAWECGVERRNPARWW